MAVSLDADSGVVSSAGQVSAHTFAHVHPGGSLVVVSTMFDTASSQPMTAAWNTSEAMTRVATANNTTRDVVIFYLAAATAGTFNVVLTPATGNCNFLSRALSYSGIDTGGTPYGTAVGTGAHDQQTSYVSGSIVCATGDQIVSVILALDTETLVASGQSNLGQAQLSGYTHGSSTKTSASDTTVTYTWDTTLDFFYAVAIPFKAAAASSPTSHRLMSSLGVG